MDKDKDKIKCWTETMGTLKLHIGSLLFNVFLYDLFLFIPNIDLVSYVDYNTPFAMGSSE